MRLNEPFVGGKGGIVWQENDVLNCLLPRIHLEEVWARVTSFANLIWSSSFANTPKPNLSSLEHPTPHAVVRDENSQAQNQ